MVSGGCHEAAVAACELLLWTDLVSNSLSAYCQPLCPDAHTRKVFAVMDKNASLWAFVCRLVSQDHHQPFSAGLICVWCTLDYWWVLCLCLGKSCGEVIVEKWWQTQLATKFGFTGTCSIFFVLPCSQPKQIKGGLGFGFSVKIVVQVSNGQPQGSFSNSHKSFFASRSQKFCQIWGMITDIWHLDCKEVLNICVPRAWNIQTGATEGLDGLQPFIYPRHE